MKYRELIADNLNKAGWSLGVSQPWIATGDKRVVLPKTVGGLDRNGEGFLPKATSDGVSGKGKTTGFTYNVNWVQVEVDHVISIQGNEKGIGKMKLRIEFVAKTNPHFKFRVVYKAVDYWWNKNNNEVHCLFWEERENFLFMVCP